MKKDRIQICPQCGSPDIETDFSNAAAITRGFLNVMKCNHCGHEGTFFPTIHKSKLKKPCNIKQVKNVQHFDKTFARGFFKITLFAFFVFFGIIGAFMLSHQETRISSVYPIAGFLICLIILILTKNSNRN